MDIKPLVVILGPTAVGKTACAIEIACEFGGEIISADSRQLYIGMDIGTAKPTSEELAAVPHHLIDVAFPDRPFTLAEYQRAAYRAIDDVHARGGLPLLVGGTGQYISAVIEGWGVPEVPPDPGLRAELEAYAAEHGHMALHERLAMLDQKAAAKIDPRNVRRVVRALEVCILAGKPISQLQKRNPPPYRQLRIGLTRPREVLYRRIDERVDRMMKAGLLDEVRTLIRAGYDRGLPAMSGLGYAQLGAYLCGEASLEEAIRAIKRETRRFVRRQYTWFRAIPGVEWFDLEKSGTDEITCRISEWLADA